VHEILNDTQQNSYVVCLRPCPHYTPLNFFPLSVSALERLHAKHVLPGFSDRSHEEQEIEALTTDITRVCVPNLLRFCLVLTAEKRIFENVKLLFKRYLPPSSRRTPFRLLPLRHHRRLPKTNSWRPKTFNVPSRPRCKTSPPPFGRNSACIWKVRHKPAILPLPHVSGRRVA
jgi:hypothetical protein